MSGPGDCWRTRTLSECLSCATWACRFGTLPVRSASQSPPYTTSCGGTHDGAPDAEASGLSGYKTPGRSDTPCVFGQQPGHPKGAPVSESLLTLAQRVIERNRGEAPARTKGPDSPRTEGSDRAATVRASEGIGAGHPDTGTPEADYQYRERQAIGTARPPEPHRRCPNCGSGLHRSDDDGSFCSSCRWSFEHLAPRGVR